MPLKIGSVYRVDGQYFLIKRSTAKKKKKMAVSITGKKKTVHFGHSDYTIAPNKKRGQNYCTRSAGIKTNPSSPNKFARLDWHCSGKKSKKQAPKPISNSKKKQLLKRK